MRRTIQHVPFYRHKRICIIRVVDNINAKIHSNDDPKDNLLSFELEKQSFLQKLIIKHCFVAENVLRPKSFSLFYKRKIFLNCLQRNVHDKRLYYRGVMIVYTETTGVIDW